ncbi:MAG: hypothetical protein NZ805_16325, partial [Armatimonadetes bacterium]|nr:hypothetical protein [Armatimonadota bacterium]MDW8030147.1 hypothetical protein [Armatimonadota bacterium]
MAAQQHENLSQLVSSFAERVNKAGQLSKLVIDELVLPDMDLDKIAKHLKGALKSTQLRRVFHDLKRLQQQAKR